MSLAAAFSIAQSGLANINAQFGVVSQNIANVGTPNYARETTTQTELEAGGVGMGVLTGPTTREVNTQLQAAVLDQNSSVSALQTATTALGQIDAVQGTPGQGDDLASLLGNLQNAFSALAVSPDNATQQSAVVGAAQTLANQINTVSGAVGNTRQSAQNNLATDVATLNTTLGQIGSLSDQIVAAQAQGQSTADLENQRDAAVSTLSGLLNVKTLVQPDGDMLVMTASGLSLPTHFTTPPLTASAATIGAGASYPGGGIPPITLDGSDVTDQLQGGSIGADITLRDTTLPTLQGELDEFSETLSTRFAAQGLTLFTDPTGAVPASAAPPTQSGYVGYASTITVNPAVVATPSLVRDGTDDIAGSPTGAAAFTPNPAGGPSGFTTLIDNVLSYTFGTEAQAGVAQPAPAVAGLGPTGTLSAPYAAPADLATFATDVVAAEAADSNTASTGLTNAQSVQTALNTQLSSASSVSIDSEMSTMIGLQNAYAANAHVLSAVQALWTPLSQMVQ